MASFTTTSLDLLALSGAQVLNAEDPSKAVIVIPCAKNGITYNQGQKRMYSSLPVALWPKNNVQRDLDFKNRMRAQRGDEPLTIDKMPTHDLMVNYPNEYVLAQIKKFQQADGTNPLVSRVLELTTNEEYRNSIKDLDPLDTKSNLFYAVRRQFNVRLAEMYSHVSGGYQPTPSAPVAQQVSGYTPVTNDQIAEQYAQVEEEDLPF